MDDILDFGRVDPGRLRRAVARDRRPGRRRADRRSRRRRCCSSWPPSRRSSPTGSPTLLTFQDVQRVATLALIAILFDGGMSIGLRRFRTAAVPITILGVLGTFGTAPLVAVAAHYVLGFDWTVALLIGAALAPTDPAVTFSVLAGKEVEGRAGHDPRGRVGVQRPRRDRADDRDDRARTASRGPSEPASSGSSCARWASGSRVGAAPGYVLLQSLRRVPLPDTSLYPLAVARSAPFVVYGVATVAHGSGFLAVFVAGIVIGDAEFPRRVEVRHFHGALADLGELAVFVALGLTIDLGVHLRGRALVAGPGARRRCSGSSSGRWSSSRCCFRRGCHAASGCSSSGPGLKGAVPILLASLAVVAGTEQADGDLRDRVRRRPLLGRRPGDARPDRRASGSACRWSTPSAERLAAARLRYV